jgi:hypothetical protein
MILTIFLLKTEMFYHVILKEIMTMIIKKFNLIDYDYDYLINLQSIR